MTPKFGNPALTDEQTIRNREWIKDLKSGKFRQARSQLVSQANHKRCCATGVAIHTYARLTGDKAELEYSIGNLVFPRNKVRDFFGWSNWQGPYLNLDYNTTGYVNDYTNINFHGIADAIELALGLKEYRYTAQFDAGRPGSWGEFEIEHFNSQKEIERRFREHIEECDRLTDVPDARMIMWSGHLEDVTDRYPDAMLVRGPRGGVRREVT